MCHLYKTSGCGVPRVVTCVICTRLAAVVCPGLLRASRGVSTHSRW